MWLHVKPCSPVCIPQSPCGLCPTRFLLVRQAVTRQAQYRALLNRVMLRRTKEGTIKDQLPCKTDNIVFCPLAPMQKRAYRHGHMSLSY